MRLFIAIELPETIKDILKDTQSKFSKLSYTKEFHLTLKFIGEADPEPIKEALSKITFQNFTLSLSDIGIFPNKNNPRVLWIGLKDSPELTKLQSDIEQTLPDFKDSKPFHPHLTLARIKHLNNKQDFIQTLDSITIPNTEFQVKEFHLFSSQLTPKGAIHTIIESYSAD